MNGPTPFSLAASGISAGVLLAVLVWVPLALVLVTVSFRVACRLYNKASRPENHVPEAYFGRALLIVLVSGLLPIVVTFPLGLLFKALGGVSGISPGLVQVISLVVTVPLGQVISAAIIMRLLPTTFGRGLLLSLLQFIIAAVLALSLGMLIGVIVVLVMLATGGRP